MSAAAAVAIGIGCRRGVRGGAIRSLVEATLAELPDIGSAKATLFTVVDKQDEAGLREAAVALGLDLVFLSRQALQAAAARVETQSPRVEERFGVGSVAEAAALAGAGPGSSLAVPRRSNGAATCAIAMAQAVLPAGPRGEGQLL